MERGKEDVVGKGLQDRYIAEYHFFCRRDTQHIPNAWTRSVNESLVGFNVEKAGVVRAWCGRSGIIVRF
jgi:hypothetical protein